MKGQTHKMHGGTITTYTWSGETKNIYEGTITTDTWWAIAADT